MVLTPLVSVLSFSAMGPKSAWAFDVRGRPAGLVDE